MAIDILILISLQSKSRVWGAEDGVLRSALSMPPPHKKRRSVKPELQRMKPGGS